MPWDQWARIAHDVMLRRSSRSLLNVFERVHQNAAPGVKSPIYDCLVIIATRVDYGYLAAHHVVRMTNTAISGDLK